MTQVLASRLAGLRLSAIVAALLIPLFVILAVLVNQFNGRIDRLTGELYSLALAHRVLPVLLEASNGSVEEITLKDAATLDSAAVRILNADRHDAALRAALEKLDYDAIVSSADNLLNHINLMAPLGFDADNRSVSLVALVSNDLLALAKAQDSLRLSVSAANKSESQSSVGLTLALGEFKAATARVRYSLEKFAKESAFDNVRAQKFIDASKVLELPLAKTLSDVRSAPSNTNGIVSSMLVGTTLKDYNKKLKSTVELATTELSYSLEARLNALQNRRLWTVLLTALAMILSLGAAYALFRKSLLKLDEMESTQRAASAAQVQSEMMNKRLTQINSEIVHLNHELADKMRRLKDVQDELLKRGRLEQLGQLTATVAHELRNPLGAVRTSAFLLDRKIKGKGLGVEPQLQRINSGITRCDSIITQLLDFSRTKVISAQPAVFDDWLASLLEEESKRLPAVIDIECVLGLEGIDVEFDQARMQRAMINLISNASEAMVGTGEDPAKFAVQNPKLRIVTRREADTVVITVSDNGPGIPPEIMEKIREPLFTTKSFGTGLGIPAVDQIANQHGGHMEVKSEVGHGAHFSIHIPLKQPEEKAA
jgi:signal transduction histidine kinase